MCPPAPVPPTADIGLYWTDEELSITLEKIGCGSPLPGNVIPDVNPYQVQPPFLPEGVWFLIRSEEKKDAEHGFWKAKGEAINIFTNSAITGWRTTLEFYEGRVPNGRRTDWVMQEYGITKQGMGDNSKPKDSRSLCRIFLSDKQSPDNEMPPTHGGRDIATWNNIDSASSTVPNPGSASGQGSTSEFQAKNRDDATGPLAVAERLQDPPVANLPELDYILRGDYLELDDLVDPESRSSSSDNTSCLSLTSEECFDALALLKDLEQGKDASFKYTTSASAKPKEVVMHPATLGSVNSGIERKLPAEETRKADSALLGSAIEGERMHKRLLENASRIQQPNEGTSNSERVAVSPGSHTSFLEWEKKAHVGGMKKLKKYLCFM